MMNRCLLTIVMVLIFFTVKAQIFIEGGNPSRFGSNSFGGSSLSIAYGNVVWIDGGNVSVSGYSLSQEVFTDPSFKTSLEKLNIASGFSIGYEKSISRKFAVYTSFFTGNMSTGTSSKASLLVSEDNSKFSQFIIYSKYSLTGNPAKKLQVQWLLGPELLFAKKRAVIEDYVENENSEPKQYNQDVSVTEVALVTGIGLSANISKTFTVFNNGCIGIALPGKGFKLSFTMIGLKYNL